MQLADGVPAAGGAGLVGWVLSVLLVLVPSITYLAAARARGSCRRRWPRWRAASFVVGLVLVATAVSPPVQSLAHHDPRAHMVQHLLLGMFAPLALVLAAPITLLLGVLPGTHRRAASAVLRSRLLHGLGHPATAAVLDMGGLYLLHLSPLYVLTTDNTLVHHLVNVHLLLAGYLFAWSITGPDPAPRRPGMPIRVAVLIAAGAAHAYLAKHLYARASELPVETSHDVDAMQTAAQLMYYGGDVAELALAVALFATWYRLRGPAARRPAPTGPTAC